MQSHNEVKEFLDEYLPGTYMHLVLEKLSLEDTESNRIKIRNTKSGIRKDDMILLALVEVAGVFKEARDKVAEIVKS